MASWQPGADRREPEGRAGARPRDNIWPRGMTADGDGRLPDDGRRRGAVRDLRVVLLTVTAGAVNAVSFLALGNVFSSVITGNLVLLGIAAGTHVASEAIRSGAALAGYSAGVLAGAPIAARGHGHAGTWPRSVTTTLAAELCVLVAGCIGWELPHGRPRGGAQLALLVVLAAAMGMQSAAVRRLGQMSSTYLTSTLTGVLGGLATGTLPGAIGRSIGVLAAGLIGAAAGGLLATRASGWLPAIILLPLGLVIAASAATGSGRPWPARRP